MTETNRAELERTMPTSLATKDRVLDYMAKADLTTGQMAEICGYSHSALRNWLAGAYGRSDACLRRALEDTMDRLPISTVDDPEQLGRFYETENSAVIRQWFSHCQTRSALAYCYAPPGSQKTFVARHIVAEFNRRELPLGNHNRAFYVRSGYDMRPRDLVAKMCMAVGVRTATHKTRCMTNLRQGLVGCKTVFVVDEGQNLPISALETLRDIYDETPGLGVLLMGSHGLKQTFDRHAAQLEQWNSRIDAGVELRGVSEPIAREILAAELPTLDAQDIDDVLKGSTVEDRYSQTSGKRYLNIRRLFKNIEALRIAYQSFAQENAA